MGVRHKVFEILKRSFHGDSNWTGLCKIADFSFFSLSKQIKNFSNLCKSVKLIHIHAFSSACLTFKYSLDGVESLFAALVVIAMHCAPFVVL